MRRYSTSICAIVLTALLVLALGSPSTAVVPKRDGTTTVYLAQGWFDDQLVWYIGTATNNIQFAQGGGMTLAPKLGSAIPAVARNMFVVQNFQQGPVFSASPDVPITQYTGLWRVIYVKWTTGIRRPITNTDPFNAITNPTGLPPVTDAAFQRTPIVVDYPVLILGPLGLAQPTYVIPQMVSWNRISKTAVLPYFNAFCQDFITKKVTVRRALITESSNANIAPLIGANYAPTLAAMSPADSMNAWLMNPIGAINPPGQLPVLESCPSALSWRNANFEYSPIVKGHLLVRLTATASSIFTNPTTVNQLIGSGALAQVGTTTLNVNLIVTP